MTIQDMQARKRELGYSNETIASLSGVPLGTVQKIFAGITKAPRRTTLQALEKVLAGTGRIVRESGAVYGSKERAERLYSIADYYALPDEHRVELIDGVFYDMASQSHLHQAVLGQLYLQLAPCVEEHPECEILFAPSDVRLNNDDYTMVQPDLFIVCNNRDNDSRRLNGAPDFVTEVLSPSNRAHDMYRKLAKYHGAGVREYWIVDPERQKIIVYDLEHDAPPTIYTFQDTVPVLIFGGSCGVDFSRILERVKRHLPD